MKKLLLIAVAAGTMAATVPVASAQSWVGINQRQAQLDARIDAGVRDGSLTRGEAMRLRGEFNDLARLEARYRSDGLSIGERRDLDSRFDRLSSQIRYQRADNDDRGGGYGNDRGDRYGRGWQSINARQRQLDARIDAGVREGSLTRREAAGLRMQFNQIARLEANYRRHGLTRTEMRDLDRRFDVLGARITAERNDWQNRRNRG